MCRRAKTSCARSAGRHPPDVGAQKKPPNSTPVFPYRCRASARGEHGGKHDSDKRSECYAHDELDEHEDWPGGRC